jgi:hypothetical protein
VPDDALRRAARVTAAPFAFSPHVCQTINDQVIWWTVGARCVPVP